MVKIKIGKKLTMQGLFDVYTVRENGCTGKGYSLSEAYRNLEKDKEKKGKN